MGNVAALEVNVVEQDRMASLWELEVVVSMDMAMEITSRQSLSCVG